MKSQNEKVTKHQQIQRGSVMVQGIELAYTLEGAGTPLLVVGSSIYYPRTFSDHLRDFCSLICLDLPHFAHPGPDINPELISFNFYANCIEAVRLEVGLNQVVAVGHSHHGNVALEYARRFPDHVSGVVLIGSPPANLDQTIQSAAEYWSAQASNERKAILERRRASVDVERVRSHSATAAYVEQYVADAPLYWHDATYDAAWLWDGMEFSMDAIRAFRNLYASYDFEWGVELQTLPVLIVMGESDFAVPHVLWQPVLAAVDQTKSFHLIQHCGHTPQLEQPVAFDNILISWLRACKASKDRPGKF